VPTINSLIEPPINQQIIAIKIWASPWIPPKPIVLVDPNPANAMLPAITMSIKMNAPKC